MLHIHCGDSSADALRAGGVTDEVIVWSDLLYIGPLPPHEPVELWRSVRARALSKELRGAIPCVKLEQRIKGMDDALARWGEHNEVVLWFDACLYDQSILLRQLDWFGRQRTARTTVSLICIGEFPEVERYCGLGNLGPEQLAAQVARRHTISDEEYALGQRAWTAWRSRSPLALAALMSEDTRVLPYLHDAVVRQLEELPSIFNGLSRLEQQALEAVAAGAQALPEIFQHVSDKEARPYFGDTSVWACLDGLACAAQPALRVDGPGRLPCWQPPEDLSPWTVRPTAFGEEVLAGTADWVTANGVDRWVGNVQVHGREGVWRWDRAREEISKQ